MISDSAGGAILATDYGSTLFIIKINSEGNFPWGADGVLIHREGYQDNSLSLAGDGAGGAVVIWEELQYQPGITERIFAQRINSEGSLSWGQDGTLLYTTGEDVYIEGAQVTGDGSGGAIIAWHQYPRGRIEGETPKALLQDICVQRVDADGNVLWQQNGVPLGITKGGGQSPHGLALVSDGSGGAIITWEDLRHGLASIYAQRIAGDGNIKWHPGGEQVCYVKTYSSLGFRIPISDDSGGTFIPYSCQEAGKNRGIRIQRLDASGRTLWPGIGILVTDTDHSSVVISCDGYGGAIVAWGIGKDMFRSEKAYVQRISADGKLLWGDRGIRLNK